MSWFLSKVYTTLRGANSSRSTSSSVATNRSLSDAEIDSLDLNCTVSPGNNHRYSYLSYSSADKEGSSCGGWSRPESTAGSIHDGEGPDGLVLRLYGEDYILGENGECRPVHREPESKRLSTISVSYSNQNNENEKLCYATPETTDPQYEWSDEKADWITPLRFGRSRQSKRRSVRPRSENVDEMWLRVVKSVNASFDCDEDNVEEHIDNIDNAYEQPQEKQIEIVSDIANDEHNIDNKTTVKLEKYITTLDTDERQEDHQLINSEQKSNFTDENVNENDLNQEEEPNTTFIETNDNFFDYETISEIKGKEVDNLFVNEDPKDDEDEFRSSLVGTSNILNEIFQHFGLPADEVNSEDCEQVELPVESTAHDHKCDALLAPGTGHARAKEEVAYRSNDHLEQPIISAFARNGSYMSMKDCLPTDVGLLDELESIFSDRQSSLFNEEESSKEYDDIDALRKSIEDIVSGLDKSTNSEVQLKRLRQSLKKLNNFETKSIKQNKHITNDSSSVTKATDTDEQFKPIHGVFEYLAEEQDHYSHEMHSSGKNTSTYSDNKGSWDYSFNLRGLGYDQPIEHDSIAYAVTNNIFSAASVELNKKQIEPSSTHSIPFTESIKSVCCSDQHDTRVRRSNALLEIRSEQTTNNKHLQASGGCGEPEQTIGATTSLPKKCCDKELLENDYWNYDFDDGITWAGGNGTGDILTMVKVQSELNPCKIDRRYIKTAIKPDQATSSGKDIIEEDIINSEYLSTKKLDASTGRGVGRYFGSLLGYNQVRVNDDGLTYSDFNMGCISVYCKSKSQENEHSEDDYSNSNGHKQLVRDVEIGKFGFENTVLDHEIDRSISDDELESRIALGDSKFGVSLKNDRNKNGINYTSPEIQKVSQVESYKLGTDLTNDSALSVDVFETEKVDKDDLDSGLEFQDEARDEERVRRSPNHTDDESESFSTEHTFNSSTNSGETNSIINLHQLLTDRQENSSEEIKDFCAINSKETSIDDHEKASSDVDWDSFWQEPFEFCSGNSHQSSHSPTDHGQLAQSTTEILKLKLTTLSLNDSICDIFENEGHKMGNSNTYEQRSSFDEESGEHGKDSKHGFWEVNGIKARRSGAFSTKRGSDRTSQFYVPLDTSFEEETISTQTARVLNFASFENSSTGEYILQDINRDSSLDGRLEQDDSHSDCTSASSFSFGIARIFGEETQTIDNHELLDTHLQVDNERIGIDVERLDSASVSAIESQEHRTSVSTDSITEGSSDQSLDVINQSNYRSCTNIKHWKSADGLILRLHAGTDEQTIVPADDEDKDGEESANDVVENNNPDDHKTVDCNIYEYEGHSMIHDKVNNNCNKIEDVLKYQPEVVMESCTRTEEVVTQSTMDTEYIGTDKQTEIRNLEEDWQRNRKLREKKREERRKREQALQDKVNWVRDEIKIMKQLDKKLIDQFFELRSVIHQMTYAKNRPIRDLNISDLDEEDAFYEDAEIVEFDSQATPAHEEYLPAFRGRTVSMMTPPCERRLKPGWKLNRRMPSFTTEDDVQLELLML
ncbi:uncharacterized protein LOC117118249 [Anneissia japonica]|uniref:uncharacterized protein LOC117118249 n=1 Tax=Anneissia japonica TaxID=1529436 RepID=UPI001425A28F|nr:uncharacterized protein LOC117118249 [Anneissia japonica]